MREDQFVRIQQLHDRLVEAFLEEANPDEWPGTGLKLAALDQQTRGDRYWCKKNAAATASLMMRIQSMVGTQRWRGLFEPLDPPAPAEPGAPADDHDMDREIARYEREAEQLVHAAMKRASAK